MGGAQPLAATFAGAVSLTVECQQSSIDFRLRTRYLDKQARDIDEALALIRQHKESARRSRSACSATPPTCCRNWCAAPGRRPGAGPGHRPDLGPRPDQRLPAARLERRAVEGGAARIRPSTRA
jgi:hypothetical protein